MADLTRAEVPVVLVEATWLSTPYPWFWECTTCPCAFGPLTDRDGAVAGAREHISEDHDGIPANTGLRTVTEMGERNAQD